MLLRGTMGGKEISETMTQPESVADIDIRNRRKERRNKTPTKQVT